MLRRLYAKIRVSDALIAALTLGLAPFVPAPHVWEKLQMLVAGTLVRPIDIADLAMHGLPWLVLFAKSYEILRKNRA